MKFIEFLGADFKKLRLIGFNNMNDFYEALNRLKAIHLQDNGGSHNLHQLPFDGNVNWSLVMEKIKKTGYSGAITLEPMNWDYAHLGIQEFLRMASE